MPTLLTTDKMSPELRARVEASVRGDRGGPGRRDKKPTRVAIIRLAAVIAVISLVTWFVRFQREAHAALEARREALLERLRREGDGLTHAQKRLPERIREILRRGVETYPGDRITDAARDAKALGDLLSLPMVYVRGPFADLREDRELAAVAANSYRDPFVQCLVDPPKSRDETLLLRRARLSLAGRGGAERVEPLRDALLGLSYLTRSFEDRVRRAERIDELMGVEKTLDRVPLDAARRAARAPLFLSVIDEPNDGTGPTELDGACPHHVRVELRDLRRDEIVFRMRRHVDPGWISEDLRAQYATGIDGCALALDVRSALTAPPTVKAQVIGSPAAP